MVLSSWTPILSSASWNPFHNAKAENWSDLSNSVPSKRGRSLGPSDATPPSPCYDPFSRRYVQLSRASKTLSNTGIDMSNLGESSFFFTDLSSSDITFVGGATRFRARRTYIFLFSFIFLIYSLSLIILILPIIWCQPDLILVAREVFRRPLFWSPCPMVGFTDFHLHAAKYKWSNWVHQFISCY